MINLLYVSPGRRDGLSGPCRNERDGDFSESKPSEKVPDESPAPGKKT
jgi:hypothetical protein